ncbi:hypothetical protein [Desulfoluna spongiiphila]|uniref:hypothetical protein n=1 Tax=Desulfoluna spongiiphila TaxID=419481 RepID=UPI001250E1E9|nr:hypothetical protein [Desulfoluna spongiiphila]VVS91456.1 hypothetical protein DBB_10240 [Desulfoluna spongiiphila]
MSKIGFVHASPPRDSQQQYLVYFTGTTFIYRQYTTHISHTTQDCFLLNYPMQNRHGEAQEKRRKTEAKKRHRIFHELSASMFKVSEMQMSWLTSTFG